MSDVADTFNARVVKLEMTNFGTVAIGQTSAAIPLTFAFDGARSHRQPCRADDGRRGFGFCDR